MHYAYNPENGQTDLMAAAHNGDADDTARILSMPCDIDAQDSHGMTALMYAAIGGHTDVLKLLVSHRANLELQSAQRYTALMYAVRQGHLAAVQALLAAKADPNVHRQNTFDTPLTLAAWYGYLPIVRALVAAGADVALVGGLWQLPPEGIARHQGHHHISEFLLYHEKRPSP